MTTSRPSSAELQALWKRYRATDDGRLRDRLILTLAPLVKFIVYRKVREITTPKSEAVFVACTQLRALEVLDALERDLGKPVYSAVQASAWAAYQAMGVEPRVTDCGSLLRKLSEPGVMETRKRDLRTA